MIFFKKCLKFNNLNIYIYMLNFINFTSIFNTFNQYLLNETRLLCTLIILKSSKQKLLHVTRTIYLFNLFQLHLNALKRCVSELWTFTVYISAAYDFSKAALTSSNFRRKKIICYFQKCVTN